MLFFSICPEMMYPKLKLEAKIAKVAQQGFTHIDIWDWRDKDAAELARQLKEHGVRLNAFCGHMDSSTSIARERTDFLEELQGSIRFAERFECNRMMIFSDGIQGAVPDTDPPVMPAKPNPIAESEKVRT
jgi:sugar phosphate isomerase/epimerase